MGLDLALYPKRFPSLRTHLMAERLTLDRCYNLFDRVKEKPAVPIPAAVLHYDDERGVVERVTDSYGEPLMQVWAGVLAAIPEEEWGWSEWNRAARAYLAAIPPDTPVVLWWY